MRTLAFPCGILAAALLASPVSAQESISEVLTAPGLRLSRPADRAQAVARIAAVETGRRQDARARAALRGLPLRRELPNGRVQEIAGFEGEQPLYLTTHNADAAISTGANLLRTSPYSLTGGGITIGLWDGGSGRAGHQEFGGRLIVMDGSAAVDHATHVGGTLAAAGVVPAARGMASSATVNSYDWNNDVAEMTSRGATYPGEPGKIYLSNHSYGIIGGWNYVNNGSRVWEWNGAGTTAAGFEDDFGRYNTYARDTDSLAYNAPYYLIFRSAGNDRVDNPSAGQAVSLSPGGSTVVSYDPASHPAGDGAYRGGFDTISFNAIAKNVITIGSAADAVTGGQRDAAKAAVSSFSSWGPTDDGRIKPDVVANGEALYSTLSADNAAYGTYSGTSMASPNATGSAALLVQQYNQLFPSGAMRASTLKGLLIHTADDLGNPGPDYKYGWGLINVKAAADVIREQFQTPEKQRITEDQLNSATLVRTRTFVWDGVTPIRATLCWTDPAAAALTVSDSRSARLVNNLDLKIIAPDGTEHLPFVMPFVGTWSQSSMDAPAVPGVNKTDNVEQVRIPGTPRAGTYQVVVTAGGTLVNNLQNYSLLLSGASAETPPPPPLSLASVSPASGISGTVTVDIAGAGLDADTVIRLVRAGQPAITATGGQMTGGVLRCQLDLTGAATGAWDVTATNARGESATLAGAFTVVGALWSENFDGTVTGWLTQATTGSNSWALATTASHSPGKSIFARGPSTKSTTTLTSPAIAIPAAATDLQLKFWHDHDFQSARDGGRMEYSINGGAWVDIEATGSGTTFASNGYNSTLSANGSPSSRNEFAGRRAWSGKSNGFVETIVNLTDTARFAGTSLRFRWLIATDGSTASTGWYLDSMALVGGGNLTNTAPVLTANPTSSPTETATDTDGTVHQILRAASATLSALATDDGGEAALSYRWSVVGGAAGPVFFTENASHAARATTASFEAPGDYHLRLAVSDGAGLTVTGDLHLRVLQAASGIIVSPAAVTLATGASQPFSATLVDQFSMPMTAQPASFTWSASGGGGIDAQGRFTATTVGGPFVVGAASGGFSNVASVTVTRAAAVVTLENLTRTFTGAPLAATVVTQPAGLAVAVTYDGASNPPTAAGRYAIEANIADPNYQGSATGTLVIDKAAATIELADLAPVYDGSPKAVTATTSPAGLAVSITYDGSPTPPTGAGSYEIAATVDDPNHTGAATGTLVIGKATATIELADLAPVYDGSPKAVTATTSPAGLAVSISYDGSPTPPADAGSYAVAATITDANHQGAATGSLVISGNFASWTDGRFNEADRAAGLAEPQADPDGDGLTNFAEYALGGDPRHFTPPAAAALDATGLSLTFTRPAGLPDVIYAAEASDGLGDWQPVPLEVLETGATETVRATDPAGPAPRRFIRLRFERP